MKHIRILLLSLASSFATFAADINLSSGQLEGLLDDENIKKESTLKLKGTIDARDLAALEKLSSDVKTLDLSEVKITPLTMPNRKYFGRTMFNQGEIPAYTFFKTGVTTLILPEDVSLICEGAFAGSAITEIIIPEGVTSLGDYAFYGCPNLKSVALPSSLVSIGKGAFGNCIALENINLSETKIKEIPERAFAGAVNLTSLTLPASGVEKVGREAFSHTKIGSLDLSNVSEFEAYALSSMPYLEELAINPNALIGEGVLMDNISLASLTGMPDFIPDYFAANCSELPSETAASAASLGKYSFANTNSPETLVLSESLNKIDRGALSGLTNLTKIDVTALGAQVPEVDEFTFEGLSQPDIVLWVDDNSFDVWENHPIWHLFQVKSTNKTGISDAVDAENQISITFVSGVVIVESGSVINDIRIYTTDGRMAFVASPGKERVEIDAATLPTGVIIVAASDEAGNSKNISILLK